MAAQSFRFSNLVHVDTPFYSSSMVLRRLPTTISVSEPLLLAHTTMDEHGPYQTSGARVLMPRSMTIGEGHHEIAYSEPWF